MMPGAEMRMWRTDDKLRFLTAPNSRVAQGSTVFSSASPTASELQIRMLLSSLSGPSHPCDLSPGSWQKPPDCLLFTCWPKLLTPPNSFHSRRDSLKMISRLRLKTCPGPQTISLLCLPMNFIPYSLSSGLEILKREVHSHTKGFALISASKCQPYIQLSMALLLLVSDLCLNISFCQVLS